MVNRDVRGEKRLEIEKEIKIDGWGTEDEKKAEPFCGRWAWSDLRNPTVYDRIFSFLQTKMINER